MNKCLSNAFIFLLSILGFISCSKDEEKAISLSRANAYGVRVDYYGEGTSADVSDIYLWINNTSIFAVDAYEDEIDLSVYYGLDLAYYRSNMRNLYNLLSEDYGVSIDENTDFSNFLPNPTPIINYVKSNYSKYYYMANWSGGIILFNRTSDISYY